MTDVKEETVVVTEVERPTWTDSTGTDVKKGDIVRPSNTVLHWNWNEDTQESTPPRPFDFGEVDTLNDDGTVSVFWDAAGCSCSGEVRENVANLAVANDGEQETYDHGYRAGWKGGQDESGRQLRELLGLPDNLSELAAELQAPKNTVENV